MEHAAAMHRVVGAFCAATGIEVRTPGHVAAVELPMPRSALREAFHRQTAAEWLIARRGMSRQHAAMRLNQFGVNPDAPLSTLAGNPRWMIGFVAAMFGEPSLVVFTTTGCDPLGIQRALATAKDHLGDAAGVYLTCFPNLGIAEPEYAAVLEMQSVAQRVA